MPSRFRDPRRIPQPDRDFAPGSRPQDTLNRAIPWNQGRKGTVAGLGQASSFKPRQQQMRRRTQQPQTQQRQTQQGVQMTFAGDPDQIAQTFQSLVNNTGQIPTDRFNPNPLAPKPPGGGWMDQVPDRQADPEFGPAPVETIPTVAPEPEQPLLPPAVSTPETEFSSLHDYFDAVGRLDLIDENAYRRFGGWTPQIPEFAQQKIALDNDLQTQLVGAVGNQETAKAMQRLILSRLIEDEAEDQSLNRETSAARGLFNSTIRTDDSKRINKGYMRNAGEGYASLIGELLGIGGGLNTSYNTYLTDVLGLSAEEAAAIFERGGGGGGGTQTKKTSTTTKKAPFTIKRDIDIAWGGGARRS